MAKFVVAKDAAVDLLKEGLGFTSANRWSEGRLARKLRELGEGEIVNEDDFDLDDDQTALYLEIKEAVEDDCKIEVVDEDDGDSDDDDSETPEGDSDTSDDDTDDDGDDPSDDDTDDPPQDRDDSSDDDENEEDDESLDKESLGKLEEMRKKLVAKVRKKREKEKAKAEKAKNGKKKGKGTPGPDIGATPKDIRSLLNRLFYAGVVLKKRGLKPGLTDELIKEVTSMMPETAAGTDKASRIQLGMAWHVVNGFLNGGD